MEGQTEDFLSTGEVAHRLGVSATWIHRLAETGKLQAAARTPLGLLFEREVVERYAKSRETHRDKKKHKRREKD